MRHNKNHDWDTLWVNATLATMAEADGYGIIEQAALAISDGKIAWVGKQAKLPGAPEQLAAKVIDAKGKWLLPGLIDCHTHLVYGGNRAQEFEQRLNGASYEDIAKAGGGILSTVRATRDASLEDLLAQSSPRLEALLKEGVTTVEIKSGYGLNHENEIKMLRAARTLAERYPVDVQTTFLGAHTLPPEFSDADAYIAHLIDDMLPAIAREQLADAVDAYLENIAFSPEQVARLFSKAKALEIKLKLHSGQFSDLRGAQLAAEYGALSADHLEHASEEGIRAMAEAGVAAVLLPGAFYTLRETTLPPADLLRKWNVPIAIATDCNPGTSPVTSLLLMLNMACTLFRLTPVEALAGVTQNAARALGLQDTIGTLEVGKQADIALFDIDHPAELTYRIGYNPCVGVVKSGHYHAV